MAQGFTLWLTGLPGSGKTEIAIRVEESLLERGLDAERLDEGEIREQFLPGLGSEKEASEGLVRLLGHVCNLLTRNGAIAVASSVSPDQATRNEVRSQIGTFVEVYVKSSAVDASYEEPIQPEILIDGGSEDVEASTRTVLKTLEILGLIPKGAGSDYDEAEEEKITKRLKDLGYI